LVTAIQIDTEQDLSTFSNLRIVSFCGATRFGKKGIAKLVVVLTVNTEISHVRNDERNDLVKDYKNKTIICK